jgi:hypothetical protein
MPDPVSRFKMLLPGLCRKATDLIQKSVLVDRISDTQDTSTGAEQRAEARGTGTKRGMTELWPFLILRVKYSNTTISGLTADAFFNCNYTSSVYF